MPPLDPPFTVVDSTDGVRVAVHDLGGPDNPSAPVLLFSHATGFHGRVWAPMAARLADRFRCLAIDYRGHGLTETPSETSMVWSGMGDDALAVIDGELIGPDRTLHGVGHSMGGAALVLAAGRRPGRFRSLWLYEPVLMPPVPLGPLELSDLDNPMSVAAARRRAIFGSFEEAMANFASKPPLDQLRPDALEAYVEGGFARQADGTVALRCLPISEAAVFGEATSSGAWEVLPTLDLPVAVVAGRREGAGPVEFAPAAAEAVPDGTLIDRPALGHFGPLEDPDSMAQDLADWVDAHP